MREIRTSFYSNICQFHKIFVIVIFPVVTFWEKKFIQYFSQLKTFLSREQE